MRLARFLVISGIPGTGKSTYCQWLHEKHGFNHQDVDWQGLPSAELLDNRPLVIDWGFPANEPSLSACLDLINSWRGSGAEMWWFDGDRDAALRSFLARGTVSKSDWDYQLGGIESNWHRLAEEVKGKVIDTITESGYKAHEQIYSEMIAAGPHGNDDRAHR